MSPIVTSASISSPVPHSALPPAACQKRRTPRTVAEDTHSRVSELPLRDPEVKFSDYGALGRPSPVSATSVKAYAAAQPARDDDDEMSTGNSSHNGSVGRRNRRRARLRRNSHRPEFEEHDWDWRFPGNEDALMPSLAWIYLPLIGTLIFVTAFVVNRMELLLREYVVGPLHFAASHSWGQSWGLVVLCSVRALLVLLSFTIVYNFAPLHGTGSGIPEMKCVLTGVFMPNALSFTTLISKMVGLSLAVASGLSVGKMGPFIHMGGIVASLVSKIPLFKALKQNPLFKLQALSAAMAAGVGATFGAPLGGVMLSIELMSSYYYIHWLPMSLYCSVMGYYMLTVFLEGNSDITFGPDVAIAMDKSWAFVFVYIGLGIVCGLIGYCLIRFTILMKKTVSWIFSMDQPRKVTLFLVAFVFLHTVVTNNVGGVLSVPQKAGVDSLFDSPTSSGYEWLNPSLQPAKNGWGCAFALAVIMWIKFALTGVSLVLPIPAGTFMPIFEIGAFLGRSYGELFRIFPRLHWIDPRATAIVGAAALTSGTLHVTSIALVMLELTREAVNIVPLTLSVVVSYAISKSLSSDLFSELIKNRRLPYILGLREQYPKETRRFHEEVSKVLAKAFMNKKFAHVTRRTTVQEARKLLGEPWQVAAFLSDEKDKRLFGVIKRNDLQSVLDAMDGLHAQHTEAQRSIASVGSSEGAGAGASVTSSEYSRQSINFLRDFNPDVGHRLVDMGVMQVSVHTPLWKVITYFRMLSMNVIYVMTTQGSVAGVITKPRVIEYCIELERDSKSKKCQQRELARQQRRGEIDALRKYDGSQRVSRRVARQISATNLVSMDTSGRRSRNSSVTLH